MLIDGFNPAKPWETAPTALANIELHIQLKTRTPPFPNVEELDAECDSWPESGNHFSTHSDTELKQTDTHNTTSPSIINQNSINYTVNQTMPDNCSQQSPSNLLSHLIQSVISSEDKLFFISTVGGGSCLHLL